MAKKEQVPAIRFQGFADPWEQRKFSDLVLIERGGSPRPIDDYITDAPDGLNWVKIGDAPEQGRYITKTAEKIKPEGLSKTRQVQPGDLILSNSMSFGKPYIMGINGCIHDGWLLIRDTQSRFDLKFLCHMLGTDQMLDQYRMFAAGSTVNNLNKELVGNTIVSLPSIDEQKVIGEYLESIDNLITLHQRKYDKLVAIKRSMLEKMFPREGSRFPEIRFAGFTDPWEQRKVGTFASVLSASRVHKDEWRKEGVPFYRSSDVVSAFKGNDNERAFISTELYEELIKSSGRLEKGDILITGGGSIGIPYIVPNNEPLYSKDADLIWIKKSAEHDSQYLYAYFTSQGFREYISSISHVGTIAHYTIEQVKDTPVLLPSVAEQSAIGLFFSQLDTLITLHQRKLEKLQAIKRSMLEKMFV